MSRGKTPVHPVLIIEMSATWQHAVRRLLKARGYTVSVAKTYEDGLQRLHDRSGADHYAAVIFGHLQHPYPQADEVMPLLRRSDYRDLAVLVLTHATDPVMLDWAARGARTALLSWDD